VPEELLALARRVAAGARAGEAVEAYVMQARDTSVEVFDGEVESMSVAERSGVGVRVLWGRRQGYAWAGTLDPAALDEVLAEARDNASCGEEDGHAALPGRADVEGRARVAVERWSGDVLETAPEAKVSLALDLDRACRGAGPSVRGAESSSYHDSAVRSAVAGSEGIEASSRRTSCSLSTVALVADGDGTSTGHGFSAGASVSALDLEAAASDAVARAERLVGARPAPSGRLPVLFDPVVTRSLLGLIGSALGGEAVTRGRSMFEGRLGDDVAPAGVTLVDDPTDPSAFGAAAHDAEGVPTAPTPLIASGRLVGFLHNVATGRRAGTATTGSAVRPGIAARPGAGARALYLVPGRGSPEELRRAFDELLYVQSVKGLHSGTNPVSGDFSVGAEGLMVRGGEWAEPVREVTVASTVQRMLRGVVGVGADHTWLPGPAAGVSLLVDGMALAGR